VPVPTSAYRVMRKLWPHVPRSMRRRVGRRPLRSGLPTTDPIVEQLERDGVVVLDQRLPAGSVDALVGLAQRVEVRSADGQAVVAQEPDALPAPRYDVDERDLLADPAVQELVVHPPFRELAEAYLGGEVVSDLAAMWWSVAQPSGPSSAAAQLFHTDRDRLSFLKFFVYLTDVDENHGPHVYVRGSHRHLPPRLRADRRYEDRKVLEVYGPDALVSITGPKGTVFVADTSGLHKGLPPQQGHRLVFQLEYASNLFGAPVVRCSPDLLEPRTRAAASAHPRTYARLLED
jgi:Phytanoyl-CoA dioxygenase (PhyH)